MAPFSVVKAFIRTSAQLIYRYLT